ncbi:HNH endonuclease [Nocardiopsis sp. NPDC058789]|uniref:HNH endonuclease n=1 Tax=Nocardiopsis sp. NPDC058789 TaxID=3346634 RepID=UPI003672E5AD
MTPPSGEDLPLPDSDELASLLTRNGLRAVYRVLFESRGEPLTMNQIRERVTALDGTSHSQTDRRVRDLRDVFDVESWQEGRTHFYLLKGRRSEPRDRRGGLSAAARARVFQAYGARCAWCGRTPKEDEVKIVVDHIVPLDLGGPDREENCQLLCEEDNHAKQARFAEHKDRAEAISKAINHDDVHLRIGELLKALKGTEVPIDLINLVAREENRGDPTRRLRELRILGWTVTVRKEREGKRTLSYYTLEHAELWPDEGPGPVVRRAENERRRSKKQRSG